MKKPMGMRRNRDIEREAAPGGGRDLAEHERRLPNQPADPTAGRDVRPEADADVADRLP